MCLWNKALEFLLRMSSVFLKRYFKGIIFLVLSSLNKLDTATKGTKWFSNPQALSSTLAMFRTLQPWAFGLLNHLVPLVLASNYYLVILDEVWSNPGYSGDNVNSYIIYDESGTGIFYILLLHITLQCSLFTGHYRWW